VKALSALRVQVSQPPIGSRLLEPRKLSTRVLQQENDTHPRHIDTDQSKCNNNKKSHLEVAFCHKKLVAGAGFEPATFGL